MRRSPASIWASATTAGLVALVLLIAAPAALAAGPTPPPPPKTATRITLGGTGAVTIGSDVTVAAHLTTAAGTPIAGKRLILGIRSVDSRTTRTGADGAAQLSVPSNELAVAGTLPVSVTFDGDSTYAGAIATASIVIQPASIVVQTVPAVPGIRMTLGESLATTDGAGVATFLVDRVGRVQLVPDLEVAFGRGLRVSFVRWEDDVFDLARTINVKADDRFILGLRTAVQMSFRFLDPQGRPVDPATVERVKLVEGSGQDRTLTAYDNIWFEASIPVRRTAGLIAIPNLHRISEVIIAGTNVVNRGQQVFDPIAGGVVSVDLLLYDLQVRAQDALLGWPVATEVRLKLPDGTERTGQTESDGSLVFSSLPRGDYTIRLGASGIVPPSPIALSRPQEATIRVISTLDLSLAGVALLLAVIALVVLGRRHQVQSAGARARDLAGTAASQAAVAAYRSDRAARALFDGASAHARVVLGRARTRALLGQLRAQAPPGPVRAQAPLGGARPRPAAVAVDLRALRSRSAKIASGSWTGVRRMSEEQGLRLLIVGVAVIGVGGFAAIVAAVGLTPAAGDGSATPSAPIVEATATPHPTPLRTAPGAAELRSIIQVNGYLAQDRTALETTLGTSPIGTADLVSLLSQVSLHIRVASEALARVDPTSADAPVVASLGALYVQIGADTSAALSVTISDAAAYQANALAIAALLAQVEPLTAQLQAVMDEIAGGLVSPAPSPTSGGDLGATPSGAP